MPYPAVDLGPVRTYSLARRPSRVMVDDFVRPGGVLPPFENPDSQPSELDEVAERIVQARRKCAPVIVMLGGHVVKRGLALLLIDLMERGVVTHLASNGAASIHDFEIALQGSTSEDVASSLEDGSFGMAEETGAWMNAAIHAGVAQGMGAGEALGARMDERFRFREYSLLYNAYRLGIPYTLHIAIGTDIIHQHPLADFAALGWASGQDFKIFTQAVTRLEGGVFCNFGSSVIGPEVFLKALSIARNLGNPVRVITTANFDLLPLGDYRRPLGDDQIEYYYRPRKNIINRPTSLGGRGFHITGDHKDTLPNLAARVLARLGAETLPVLNQRIAPDAIPPAHPSPARAALRSTGVRATDGGSDSFQRLARARLIEILDAIHGLKVGVIGDFTLDAYWYADMTRARLSRETPLFPRPVVRETYSPGGAANVAWNLASLGPARADAFTLLGADWRGQVLSETLERVGVSLDQALTLPNLLTPLYGKVRLENGSLSQEDARLDFVNSAALPDSAELEMLNRVAQAAPGLDVLIVADYQEGSGGLLTPRLRAALSDLALRSPRLTWVADSREHIDCFAGMVLKPNEVEAARLLPSGDAARSGESALRSVGLDLHSQAGKPVFLTRGERGCLLFEGGVLTLLPAVQVPPPVDTVGAGDTFVACLAACLGAGAAPWEAGLTATLAAAVTVRILRMTGTASPQTILDQYDEVVKA